MNEEWRDIKDYEGFYQVSNMGNVRSVDRYAKVCGGSVRLVKGRVLKQGECTNGYMFVILHMHGKTVNRMTHRLVASAFIDNPQDYPQVNHKDENIKNNCVDNLEWCTPKYNANYGTRNERVKESKKKYNVGVRQLSLDGTLIKEWECMSDACREVGADVAALIRACKGKAKTCRGFLWEYANAHHRVKA